MPKSKLLYDWRSVSHYVLVSGTPLGPMTRFYFFLSFAGKLLCSSSWSALSDDRTGLWFLVQSVSCQSRGGLITTHYCLIWEYWVPFPSSLTTRRDYGGSILTRLNGDAEIEVTLRLSVSQYILVSSILVGLATRYYFLSECCCLKFTVLYLLGALSDERTGLQFAA
jgi:hypothetical protein